ncbi:MAG TPA: PA2779 family protein [Usitatibacter sp.]|nr:PA2779 family protein [Usitatibacter sp.]
MRSSVFKMICRLLIASLTLMSLATANAGMIAADQLAASSSAQLDRVAVLSVLNRPEVASQLQAQGVDPQAASERIAAMTDDEVQALRGQIDSLPAGAKSNGWWIAAVVVVAIIIWYMWMQ